MNTARFIFEAFTISCDLAKLKITKSQLTKSRL
jgi:hypothetical protein